MRHPISRHRGLASAIALVGLMLFGGQAPAAETAVELGWGDLLPERGASGQSAAPTGIVQHGQLSVVPGERSDAPVTTRYNGKRVRIPGYVVPLDFSGAGVREFILVPYVGACIHVPPPPSNQIVFVTTDEPHQFDGLFVPVYVTGTLDTMAMHTELADIGYAMTADTIEYYE